MEEVTTMGAARRRPAPSEETIEAAGELARQVKRAASLDDLAEALDAVGRADEEVYRLATAKIDFTKLPRFGGAPVEEEGVLSWDASAVLLVGDSLTDLTIRMRPGAGAEATEEAATDAPANEASPEAPEAQDAPAQGKDPLADFEPLLRRHAGELGVEVTSVHLRAMPQEVTIQITVPKNGSGVTSQTKRSMAKWRTSWRQIAVELAQQLHLEGQEVES